MAWIESHQELARHPKTKRLARLLDVSIPTAVGHLHLFWWWAIDYAPDGDLGKYDHDDIADAAMWLGDSGQFVTAMTDAGFCDIDDTAKLTIHDWDDYAGRLIDKRRQNAERQRLSRARHKHVTCDTSVSHRATVPYRTVPYTTQQNLVSDALKAVYPGVFDSAVDGPFVERLFSDFPDIDLCGEIENWRLWLLENPKRTPKNYRLSFRNWCKKAESFQKGGGRYGTQRPTQKRSAYADLVQS